MTHRISVVVTADGSTSPRGLIASLDTQSLTTDEFELVVLNRGLSASERDSLQILASRRPNFRIVHEGQDWKAAAGTYVLGARPYQKLYPEALAQLKCFADERALDVVAGRPVQPRLPLAAPFLTDRVGLEGEHRARALGSTVLLVRRDRVETGDDGLPVNVDGASVGLLASYPTSYEPATTFENGTGTVVIDAPTLSWDTGKLVTSLTGSVVDLCDPSTVTVVARQVGTHLSYLLTTESSSFERLNGARGDARWWVTARIDPRKAAAGQPLTPGIWELDVVVSGSGEASTPSTVKGVSADTALLCDAIVSVGAGSTGALQIDVGPCRLPVISRVDPAESSVCESARGSELRVRLPNLYILDVTSLPGQLGIGKMLVPAKIELIDGGASLTAFVSGLSGSQPLSAKFGRSPLQSLGVSLSISGVGEMRVVPTPPPPTPVKSAQPVNVNRRPAKPSTKKPRPKRKARGLLAKVRRAVPETFEPLAHRLSEHPLPRRIYRRLTGLSR